ncbi:MAG: fibronectin type III domain-containing protein, partial [Vicinamibacterales bacterium]
MAAGVIVLAIALFLTSAAEAATVTRGPYLQMGTQDRIVVRWRTDVATDSRVTYGPCFGDENCLIFEKVDQTLTTEHEVLIDGLAPNTRYYYAVGTTTDVLEGND